MIKHKHNTNMIIDGKTYYPINGILELPIKVDKLNPIEENPKELLLEPNEKEALIKMAVELGCGAESSLKRNSIETLKKKIEEA